MGHLTVKAEQTAQLTKCRGEHLLIKGWKPLKYPKVKHLDIFNVNVLNFSNILKYIITMPHRQSDFQTLCKDKTKRLVKERTFVHLLHFKNCDN